MGPAETTSTTLRILKRDRKFIQDRELPRQSIKLRYSVAYLLGQNEIWLYKSRRDFYDAGCTPKRFGLKNGKVTP